MTSAVVNWSLYFVTFVLIATGAATIGTNRADAWWLYDAHRYAGALMCVLLIPKFGIILRAYARRFRNGTWNQWNVWAGLLLTVLLLVSTVAALVWTLNLSGFWVQVVFYLTPLALHWYVAIAVMPFFLWHVWVRWVTRPKLTGIPKRLVESGQTRRQALYLLGAGALGAVGFGAMALGASLTEWKRRFTGSRVVAEFSGNDFPVTQSDATPSVDAGSWRLVVQGAAGKVMSLSYGELLGLELAEFTATLDCTLGWAATQSWRGVRLADLLARVGWDGRAAVTVYAVTGTPVALSPEEVGEALVATHVGGEVLNVSHGYPARLVVPSRRGYQWLKWVGRVVVS